VHQSGCHCRGLIAKNNNNLASITKEHQKQQQRQHGSSTGLTFSGSNNKNVLSYNKNKH